MKKSLAVLIFIIAGSFLATNAQKETATVNQPVIITNHAGSVINTHLDGVVEDNSSGTHEFIRLTELIGCEPYIS
ncbi:MAG: hypothetical protein MUF36_06165 [Bacteroidales bacterium]|jgi:hypothetical protein|nr:hypothetical protein [Bacteroidales bacterium]